MHLVPGVETIGELELIEYLQQVGIMPGAILLPWQRLYPGPYQPQRDRRAARVAFGAARLDELWNFYNAQTLVF